MLGLKILVVTLVVLTIWVLSTADSDLAWKQKRALALRGHQNQLPQEGDLCWLGAKVHRARAAPQYHLFGVYPSRQVEHLSALPGRELGLQGPRGNQPEAKKRAESYAFQTRTKSETRSGSKWSPGSGGEDELEGQTEAQGHDENYSGSQVTFESPGEIESNRGVVPTTSHLNKSEPESRRKVRKSGRHRREAEGSDAEEKWEDSGSPSRRFHPRPKQPRDRNKPLGDGRARPTWEGNAAGSQGGMPILYFSGRREQLLLRPEAMAEIPRETFTVEAWLKPEGGQNNPAVIAGVFDNCSHPVSDKGWALGIRSAAWQGRKDARFFFSLRTDRVQQATAVTGHSRYQPGAWTHVAATYDGRRLGLYVDGTRVASSLGPSGPLHSPFMASCRSLLLGGDGSGDGHRFRGHLGFLALWDVALPQGGLQRGFLQPGRGLGHTPVLTARLASLEGQWVTFKDGEYPKVEVLRVTEPEALRPLAPPPCGRTACDNVELISQYNTHWPLRREKVIRYRVVNVLDSAGLHPVVGPEQIARQHQALTLAFGRYNITWELSVHEVRDSTLRHRVVLVNCEPSKIGNDHCDPECEHPLTGYDGGDCGLQGRCFSWNRRDGICHMECNNMLDDFDDGDCCDPKVTDVRKTCFDPDSPRRAYMSVKELKEALQLNSTHFLNVYFASSVREDLAGAATWPWDKEAVSHLGGVVLNPAYYGMPGHTNIMIHEVGHVLGLYHIFKGVSERESCDDPCRETVPSMETGDLCADTAPTPKTKLCQDPEPGNDTCGQNHFSGTPFNNYMSYTDDDCTDSFTPNQVARMHCYLDLVYQQWSHTRNPTPIPIPPVVVGQERDSLTIHWLPPISGVLYEREPGSLCGVCTEDGTFHQYVHTASSRRVCDSSGYWTPEEAVGPPDVEQPCEPSLQAWSPELHLYHMNMTVPCPSEGCSLELRFLHPVHPEALTLWVTYLSADVPRALFDLEILTEHDESVHLGPLDTFCDTPLTVQLDVNRKVWGVNVYTFDERMEIDAALLTSKPQSPLCSGCKPVRYRVLREPPFASHSPVVVAHPQRRFTDTEVTPGQVYRYQVQAAAGAALGEASPPLIHTHGTPFCGDGLVTETLGEECDDGDLLDGNGCSRKCEKEEGFNCVGEPSQCYIYEGDGICEPFERTLSSADCGLYTPKGYLDQWATQAFTSHQDSKMCPVSLVTGEPLSKVCKSHQPGSPGNHSLTSWSPCSASQELVPQGTERSNPDRDMERDEKVWLKVCFERPGAATAILIFLASDGMVPGDQHRSTVTLHLSDVSGHSHSLGTYELSCQQNPLIINVTHNLNFLFHRTASVLLNFSSPSVAISAVALRIPSSHLSPPIHNSCIPEQEGQSHQSLSCSRDPCDEQESCTPLLLDHAYVNCTGGDPGPLKCVVTCDRGFFLQASGEQSLGPLQKDAVLTCAFGRWNQAVSCEPLDCGVPHQSQVYYASFSCPEGTAFQKRCSFTCIPPAKLQGMNQWLICLEDGLWSLPEAYCKLECDAPPAIPNASLLVPRCLQGNHDVGSVCRYRCKPGYHVAEKGENRPRNKVLKIQCLEGGVWEQGSCIPVVCKAPSPVFEGMYNCTNGFELGSQCVIHCNPPRKKGPTFCTKEGLWTEEFKLCENLQGECPPPSELNLVEYKCSQGFGIGAVCTPSCVIPPSDPVILPENVTADTMGHWMEPSKVQNIVCTGRRRWHPDPTTVHCIQSCEPFQADGWCDTINNRAYCRYDGGDCCSSTLSSRKVVPFAADCDQDECTCRDPKAEENQQLH
ncbi:pappalysin-2 [Ornithorhynchus anatinus]|uniref:Pappalysin 2 n=1 Tax=Ornithorhynchus anatinus TaxID=9258 RepID=F6PJ26_ORNAN|nr:pappalysin-2 [Ornithorhynchus anatinus]